MLEEILMLKVDLRYSATIVYYKAVLQRGFRLVSQRDKICSRYSRYEGSVSVLSFFVANDIILTSHTLSNTQRLKVLHQLPYFSPSGYKAEVGNELPYPSETALCNMITDISIRR